MSPNGTPTRPPAETRLVPLAEDTRHMTDLAPDVAKSRRHADRQAMERLLSDSGFEHATGSLANAVAVAVTPHAGRDYDARLETAARRAEATVLDTLVHYARSHGWRPGR